MPSGPAKPEIDLPPLNYAAGERMSLASVDVGDGAKAGHRKISGVASTGAPVRRMFGSAIIDLAGVELPESGQPLPLLLNHGLSFLNPANAIPRLGFISKINKTAGDLSIEGMLLASNETSRQVIADAEAGYPWQLSISVDAINAEELKPGATAVVNGRTVVGPMSIARQSRLREVSLVEIGADPDTTTELLSRASRAGNGASPMPENTENTIDLSKLTPEQIRQARPELFQPQPEQPATFEQLSALNGGDSFTVACMKDRLTLTAAREKLASQASERAAAAEAKAKELEEKLALAKQAQSHAPVTSAPNTAQAKHTAGAFPGTAGSDPEADWELSAALQEHWKNKGGKAGFITFAKLQQSAGLAFNEPLSI